MTSLIRPLAILTLAAWPMLAQPVPAPRPGRIARAIHLTEVQQASIRAIREKHRPDMVARRDAVRQAQAAFRTALQDPSTPEARLRALHGQASAARFELMLAGRSMRREVRAVLTPEQRARVAARVLRRERLRHLRLSTGLLR